MNTNSAFTGSYTESPFCYQHFGFRQTRTLKGGRLIVNFDAADNCCLYVTTMKAKKFPDVMPSIPIDYVLVFDFTSMQDATENFQYTELIGEPLRLKLNFFSSRTMLLNSLCFENERLRSQLTSLVLLEKISKTDNASLHQFFNQIPLLKHRYLGSLPSDYVPILNKDTFAFTNMQPRNMQGEHLIMIANSCHKL